MKANTSIERLVITKLLRTKDKASIEKLIQYRESFYGEHREYAKFIFNYYDKYGTTPDMVTFVDAFPDIDVDTFFVDTSDSIDYLADSIKNNKRILMMEAMVSRMTKIGIDDASQAWRMIHKTAVDALDLDDAKPRDIIKEAEERAENVKRLSQAKRIPTGFAEIDKLLYGGFSTVEEFALFVARTNTGKSWVATKLMESAQRNGFPCLIYSPEMQSDFLATRFDTWRGQHRNSQIYRGNYSDEYLAYIDSLKTETTSAYIIEDKDFPENACTVSALDQLVKRLNIKLLIIDGLSYVKDEEGASQKYLQYENISKGLFKLSKQNGCAVVAMLQASRATKDEKDEHGVAIPDLYSVENSDSPARICTQAFCMRQIFEKSLLQIRMEKSRTAANTKPVFTYKWAPGEGSMVLDSSELNDIPQATAPVMSSIPANFSAPALNNVANPVASSDDDVDDDVEF